jgi:capsular exopolysaccharide synthesis family protein
LEADNTADRLDLERWLKILRRRWHLIAACFVLVTGSAALFSLAQQKQYTATASLFFNQSHIGSDLVDFANSSSNTTALQTQADNVRLVQSSPVAAQTARALGSSLTTNEIAQKISVSAQGQSDFVEVQATDPDPKLAAELANLYAQHFIAFRKATNTSAVIQVRNSLQSQFNSMLAAQRYSPAGLSLQRRIADLNTLAAAQTGDVQLVQPAGVPSSPASPNTKMTVVIGALLGLLLGVGVALLLERLNRRVSSVEELGRIYGYPVLAEVPESAELGGGAQASLADGYAHNSFDMLRVHLRYLPAKQVKSLLVTSCRAQEGKTTVAWNLAEATARSTPSRVLLIEADLRHRAIAARCGLQDGPGLADVLSDECDFSEAIQKVAIATPANGNGPGRSVDVIVAGAVSPNPTELTEGDRMHALIRRAARVYDLTIIDSGPALLVPDVIGLIRQVTGVLVVSRLWCTPRDEAAQLREQLTALGAPAVGVVANCVEDRAAAGYYYSTAPTSLGGLQAQTRPFRQRPPRWDRNRP